MSERPDRRLDLSRRIALSIALSIAVVAAPTSATHPDDLAEVGQDAFAALAEIATALAGDEATDWSRVNLLALREHLVDMNEVVLRATVDEQPVEGGVQIRVTGVARTLEALRRMVPMHAQTLGGHRGWEIAVEPLADGFEIALTTVDPTEQLRLRGLGFFGFLAAGDHHRHHHLALASGTMDHASGAVDHASCPMHR